MLLFFIQLLLYRISIAFNIYLTQEIIAQNEINLFHDFFSNHPIKLRRKVFIYIFYLKLQAVTKQIDLQNLNSTI